MRAYLGIDIDYIDLDVGQLFPNLQKVKSQHLTLYFWKNLVEEKARELSHKLQVYNHEPFSVDAAKLYAFPDKAEPYLVALQFNSLGSLSQLREEILAYLGLESSEKFEPHITLYRKQKLDSSFKESKEFLQEVPTYKIQISNVALYSSEPDKGVNQYRLLIKKDFS